MKKCVGLAMAVFLCLKLSAAAQTSGTAPVAPLPLIQFSGLAADEGGSSLSGVVSITFSLYIGQQGGEPLWTETQNNVQLDPTGHYSVQLGITKPNGVPTTLFTTGEARWLGVRIAEQAEQPRVLLLSVPYALKAGDATTIGGLPPSAFVLAAPQNATASPSVTESASGQSVPPPSGAVTGTGTVSFVPLWDTTSDIVSSVIFQSGTGSTAKIGINTATPASTLDVKGASTIRGTLGLPSIGTATATKGANSQPLVLVTSAFNSGTSKPVTQTFQWQAEPVENNTSSPSGSFNLLFGSGTTKPTETGLNIASNGQINFAPGQQFPGTGTITGVTTASGSGLAGGGTSGALSLGLTSTCATGQVLQWNGSSWACATVSGGGGITGVLAGTDLTGGGSSGTVTLNLDTTKVPLLAGANTFTNNQAVDGNLSATGIVTGSSFQIGSNLFGFGSVANSNAFLGFAGNTTMTGGSNTASGFQALLSDSTGSNNTATGVFALGFTTTGSSNSAFGSIALSANSGNQNTGVGDHALSYNTTGNQNTAVGVNTGIPTVNQNSTFSLSTFLGYNANTGNQISLTNATALGANAQVTANNAMVLGSINGVNGAAASTNVGIGTTAPAYSLDVHGTANFTGLVNFASGQTFPGTITGVTTAGGSGLTGGGSSGTLNLGLTNTCATGQVLQWNGSAWTCTGLSGGGTITGVLTPTGSGLTGGGSSGTVTLAVDPSQVPLLSGGNLTVNGNLSSTGVVTGSSFQIGSNLFGFGTYANSNAFLGFAGNTTMTGSANTASGLDALYSNTTGSFNTASGGKALYSNTTGTFNTASGSLALYSSTTGAFNTASGSFALYSNTAGSDNTASGYNALTENNGDGNSAFGNSALSNNNTGTYNTALGFEAGPDSASINLNYATAIGAHAVVSASNAMTLGAPGALSLGAGQVNVGIGTATPAYRLDLSYGDMIVRGQTPFNLSGEKANLYVGDDVHVIQAVNGQGIFITSASANGLLIADGGNVGIGTAAPDNLLSVNGSADKPGGGSWGTFSDRRLKTLDGSFSSGLSQVLQINPVRYRYKEKNAMGIRDREEHVGLVAQDVQKVIPEAVTENNQGYLLVNNDPIIWAMLNAIKEQQALIRQQQKQIKNQHAQIAHLTSQVKTIQAVLKTESQAVPEAHRAKVNLAHQ